MTEHAHRLLLYTTSQGMNENQAMAWLDQHTPGWRTHDEPLARQRYDKRTGSSED